MSQHRIRSVTFCEAEDCPGHTRVIETPGRVVLTDDPARPLAYADDEEVSRG